MGNYDYDALPLSASVYCFELSLLYFNHTLTALLVADINLSGLKFSCYFSEIIIFTTLIFVRCQVRISFGTLAIVAEVPLVFVSPTM
jgi:hypothetical protein